MRNIFTPSPNPYPNTIPDWFWEIIEESQAEVVSPYAAVVYERGTGGDVRTVIGLVAKAPTEGVDTLIVLPKDPEATEVDQEVVPLLHINFNYVIEIGMKVTRGEVNE